MKLAAASAVAAAVAVAFGAAPAAAAVNAPTQLTTACQPCAAEAPGPYRNPPSLNDAHAVVLQGTISGTTQAAESQADFHVQLGAAPTVTSTDYPAGDGSDAHGAIGVPGTFVLTPHTTDVVTYHYRVYSREEGDDTAWRPVPANGPGGTGTIRWTPTAANYHAIRVRAVDRDGNVSDEVSYVFYVKETRPSIWSAAYPDRGANLDYNVGVPGAFVFTSSVDDTASFDWRIDGGQSGSVAAAAEGSATAMIAPTRSGRHTLYVRSVTGDGTKHVERAYQFLVDNGPRVTGDTDRDVVIGSSLQFHLAPRVPHVEAYVYWFEYKGPNPPPIQKITIPARADGTADMTWAATDVDVEGIRFQSRSTDSTLSEPRYSSISVDGAAPDVTRTGGDDLGTVATFKVRSYRMADVVDYVMTINGDKTAKLVIKPGADGFATFRFTPPNRGYNYVTVVARNAMGVQSTEGRSWWNISDAPKVASEDYPAAGHGRFAPGSFTFTPRLAGTKSYEYSFDFGSYTSLAANSDGAATLTWTPNVTGTHYLSVRSRAAASARSLTTQYIFEVGGGTFAVTAVDPTTVADGDVRTITVRGTWLHRKDAVVVTPAGGAPLDATVTAVSADRTTLTANVDLTSAPAGRASVTVRPYGAGLEPVTLAGALTITAGPLHATKAPAISGTAAVGKTVTATSGDWTPAATSYEYQWSANGKAIDGATGTTYRVPAAVLGKQLTVTVTAKRDGYPSGTATSAATTKVAKGAAPTCTKKPKITGTAQVGRTVQATVGTWSPEADSYRHEWRVDGTLIRGATGASVRLTAAMRGKRITVIVIAVKVGHTDGRATSAGVTVRR